MRRVRKALTTGAVTVLLAVGFSASVSTTAIEMPQTVATESGEVSQRGQALADLRTCLNREGAVLDVYYLIDNSSSMKQIGQGPGTDQNGLRFRAVQSSLRPLQELANEGKVVNVAGGIFSSEARTQTLVDWTQLNPGTPVDPAVIGDLLAAQDPKGGTNWVTGIQEAQRQLSQQAEGSNDHCQALVWVTDGGIDIERDSLKTSQGVVDLCGVGPTDFQSPPSTQGLMYGLRNQGVVVLGVLLAVPDSDEAELSEDTRQERASKTSYFRPAVEGSGRVDAYWFNNDQSLSGDFTCGATVAGATGALLTIETADELANQFDALASCIADTCTTLPPDSVRCQGDRCEVAIPAGIASMQISVPEGFNPNDVKQPGGASACLVGGCTTPEELQDGAPLRIPVRNETGIWTIENSPADLDPLLFAGLSLEADPIEVDPRDPVISTRLRVVQSDPRIDEDSLIFDVQNYENIRWDANVFFPSGRSERANVVPDGDSWRIEWGPESPEFGASIPSEVIVGFSATARGNGSDVPPLPLAPIEQPFSIARVSLEQYPTILEPPAGDTLFFTSVDGLEGVGSASIVLRGPETNAGFVCWASDTAEFVGGVVDSASRPDGTIVVEIPEAASREAPCPEGAFGLPLPQAQEVELSIELTASEQAEAVVRGVMRLDLFGPVNEPPIAEEVAFEAQTTVVRNNLVRVVVLAVLTLLGVAVPYLLLVLLARRQASFNSQLNGTRWTALRAAVGPEGLSFLEERDPSDYEFLFVADKGLTRSIRTGQEEHKVKPPTIWPFKPVSTVVTAPPRSWIFTNHDSDLATLKSEGTSSQVLGDVFYFVADDQSRSEGDAGTVTDDWGNAVPTRSESGEGPTVVTGRVVLMAASDGPVADSIAQALARVRTWANWNVVFEAMTSRTTDSQESSVSQGPVETSQPSPAGRNESPGPSTGFENTFATPDNGESNRPADEKRWRGRKKNEKRNDDSGPPPGMDLSDW